MLVWSFLFLVLSWSVFLWLYKSEFIKWVGKWSSFILYNRLWRICIASSLTFDRILQWDGMDMVVSFYQSFKFINSISLIVIKLFKLSTSYGWVEIVFIFWVIDSLHSNYQIYVCRVFHSTLFYIFYISRVCSVISCFTLHIGNLCLLTFFCQSC